MDEQAVLARWSGWGALPQVFDDRNGDWADSRGELHDLLDGPQWRAAAASTLNAHYTDAALAAGCWELLRRLGFTGGRVLEPGCGSGNFLGLAPADLPLHVVGVEVEPTTAAIAAALYPDAEIRAEGFENTRLPPGSFDAAVGNVPFGDYPLHDPVHNPDRHSVHNHFLLKTLDLVKPGGLVVAFTSTWTLDARNPAARRALHQRGDLLGALRLPSGAHRAAAGTDVVTDLLVLRRRLPGEPAMPFTWERTTPFDTADGTTAVNTWFADHPDAVLGTLGLGGAHGATTLTVTADADWPDRLRAQAAEIADAAQAVGRGWSPDPPTPARPARLPTPGRLEAGSLALPDGPYGALAEATAEGPRLLRLRNRHEAAELRLLVQLRDTARLVLTAQASADPDDLTVWSQAQARLGQLHDRYRQRYGNLNDSRLVPAGFDADDQPVVRRELRVPRRIRRDPGWPLLAALEVVDADTGRISRAAIFTERVLAPHRTPAGADTAAEALSVCLAEHGHPDLTRIADLLGAEQPTARAELGDLVFADPDTGDLLTASAYLSGNVRAKLATATAAAAADPRWQPNADALRAVLPDDLTPAEIDARLGAPWIPADDIAGFAADLLDDPTVSVLHSPLTATWRVQAGGWRHGVAATSAWGTGRADAYSLLTDALNLRPTLVYDTLNDGRRVRNEADTVAAQEKRCAIEEEFSRWLWAEPRRAERLARLYNDRFNSLVLPRWDGAHLPLPGLAATFTPHTHQRDAIWRIVAGSDISGNVLLGHVVGAGKTATMVIAGMEMRRLGLVNKPLYVVPNHMLDQVGREFLQLYPAAQVLLAGAGDLARGARQQFAARCATGSWDAVIMTHASFARLPVSPQVEREFLDAEIDRYRDALTQAAENDDRFTVKQIEKAIKRHQERLARLADRAQDRDAVVSFEDLGVDYVYVDEAHLFKGLPLVTKLPLPAARSQRALDLCMKLDWLRERYGARIATFATGTPIANSLAEIWVQLRYLAPDLLDQTGLTHFDAWAATFAEAVTALELAPEGGRFRMNTRIAKFNNVPELLTLFRAVADLRGAADVHLPTPAIAGGRPQTVIVAPPAGLRDYIAGLGHRADRIRSRIVDPTEDNMLKVSLDGRLASLDLRLLGQTQNPDEGKIAACADHITRLWQTTRHAGYLDPTGAPHPVPGALQVVFCDVGTPNGERGFNAYTELRRHLAERGLPADRVAFAHDADTDAAKAVLFEACRDGAVDVLVGSTAKMGVGTNIQDRLVAIHHLDAPWRPADLEQRDGRGLRQRNQNPEVHIIRYATEGSFDAYMWQTLERKAGFISQVMRGGGAQRSIDDPNADQVLSYAEVKALATGSPLIREAAELDTEIARLRRLAAAHQRDQNTLRSRTTSLQTHIAALDIRIADTRRHLTRRIDTRGDAFTITLGHHVLRDRADAGRTLIDLLRALPAGTHHLGRLAGLDLDTEIPARADDPRLLWVDGHHDHPAGLKPADYDTTDPARLIVRIETQARDLDRLLADLTRTRDDDRAELARARDLHGQPFPHTDRLQQLQHRREELTAELEQLGRAPSPEPPTVDAPTPAPAEADLSL